jgi:Flp pilus assembly protein TadG
MRRLSHEESGASAVEMVMVLPILMIMLGGIIDFGLAYWQQHVLTSAARQGARAASLYQSTANVTAVVTQYVQDAGFNTGDLSSQITKEQVPGDTGFMNVVTVRQPYNFKLLPVFFEAFNYVFGNNTLPSSITLTGQAKMVIETL